LEVILTKPVKPYAVTVCPVKSRVPGEGFAAGCPARLQNPSDTPVSGNDRAGGRERGAGRAQVDDMPELLPEWKYQFGTD